MFTFSNQLAWPVSKQEQGYKDAHQQHHTHIKPEGLDVPVAYDFLAAVDFVVIMVKHNEIKENMNKLVGKVVLDCHNICDLQGVYHI